MSSAWSEKFQIGGHVLCQRERVKFAFISERKVAFAIAVLCRVRAVSTSGYYASLVGSVSRHARRDEELLKQVRTSHHASKRSYESPRVHADLKGFGKKV